MVLKRNDSDQREPNSARGEKRDKKSMLPPFKPPIQKSTTNAGAVEEGTPRKKKIFNFKNFNPLKSPMPSGAQSARTHGSESKRDTKKRDSKKEKKKKDTTSSSSSEESVGNVFPASLTGNHPPPHHTGETKQLFLKISYLERENKYFTQKIADMEKTHRIDQEVIQKIIHEADKKAITKQLT
jgi:hypothetical protein